MLHWALVNNLITAIGSAPFVSRPPLPHRARGYPPTVQFALLPFGETALQHFVYFERPPGVDVADASDFVPTATAPVPMSPTELQPRGQDFESQGELYRALERGLTHLADKLGEDGLFIGPPWAQARPESFQWPELVPVTDLSTALEVLRRIVEQGEGATLDSEDAHYGRFAALLEEYRSMRTGDPSFEPAHPVVAADVRTLHGEAPTGPLITDPATAAVSDLFNVVYDLVLQMLCRYFAFGHETDEQLGVLAEATVTIMYGALKPLGLHLATMPVGASAPGHTAGANFQLAYHASFLLPHRRVAWLRFAERLDEAASFAEGIVGPSPTGAVLEGVVRTLRATMQGIAAEIEAIEP
jgi:hypothetical protein